MSSSRVAQSLKDKENKAFHFEPGVFLVRTNVKPCAFFLGTCMALKGAKNYTRIKLDRNEHEHKNLQLNFNLYGRSALRFKNLFRLTISSEQEIFAFSKVNEQLNEHVLRHRRLMSVEGLRKAIYIMNIHVKRRCFLRLSHPILILKRIKITFAAHKIASFFRIAVRKRNQARRTLKTFVIILKTKISSWHRHKVATKIQRIFRACSSYQSVERQKRALNRFACLIKIRYQHKFHNSSEVLQRFLKQNANDRWVERHKLKHKILKHNELIDVAAKVIQNFIRKNVLN